MIKNIGNKFNCVFLSSLRIILVLLDCTATPIIEKIEISTGDNLENIDMIYGPQFQVLNDKKQT